MLFRKNFTKNFIANSYWEVDLEKMTLFFWPKDNWQPWHKNLTLANFKTKIISLSKFYKTTTSTSSSSSTTTTTTTTCLSSYCKYTKATVSMQRCWLWKKGRDSAAFDRDSAPLPIWYKACLLNNCHSFSLTTLGDHSKWPP